MPSFEAIDSLNETESMKVFDSASFRLFEHKLGAAQAPRAESIGQLTYQSVYELIHKRGQEQRKRRKAAEAANLAAGTVAACGAQPL